MKIEKKIETINNGPVLGYWTNFGGVEIRKIEHTPNGIRFWIKANVQSSTPTYHIRKVSTQFSNDGNHKDNIKVYNKRLYLEDCIRG